MPKAFGVSAVTITLTRSKPLAELAKELQLDFFLVSYTDLLGGTRAKLVPATKIAAIPDPESLIVLPWQPNIGWLASDVYLDGEPFAAAPRVIFKQVLRIA